MKRFLKFGHEVGSVGLMGAVLGQLVISYRAAGLPAVEFAAMRRASLWISEWVLLPSLMLVLVSGLLALAWHRGFHNAVWAWLKTATTVLVLEGTLVSVQGPASKAAELATALASGDSGQREALEQAVTHERGGLWVILFLCLVNIALAVWRPRFRRGRGRAPVSVSNSDESA
jgi:hypothetical protein